MSSWRINTWDGTYEAFHTCGGRDFRAGYEKGIWICPNCLSKLDIEKIKREQEEDEDPVCPKCKKSEFSRMGSVYICDSNECCGFIYYDTKELFRGKNA